jgi:hypothetical protein
MITASKIGLAHACPSFAALPHLEEKHAGQDEGNERHEEREAIINNGGIPEGLADRWPDYLWRAEVAFAFDVATGIGREIGSGLDRNYNAGPFEIAGTADVVGRGPCDELVIVDWKSYDPGVPRAAVNGQLHTLGLAACRTYGRNSAEVAIHHEVRALDVALLDEMDLEAFHVDLQAIMAAVTSARSRARAGEQLTFSPGAHCRYCPAFHACPVQRELTTQVNTGEAEVRAEFLMPLATDEGAREAYEFAQRVRMLLKRLDGAIYARAGERPIPLANGRMLGRVTRPGNEKLDGDVVYAVIKEKHGQAIADAAVIRSATKTRLKEALVFAGAKSVAAAERELLAEVRSRGGATKETKTVIEVYEQQRLLEVGNG